MSSGDLTNELIETDVWTDEMVERAGIPIADSWITTIGGGLGSFALAHVVRVAGLPPGGLTVLGDGVDPVRTYRHLARNSQIPEHERLRSDAGSTMDNIWGFPSYAWREAWATKRFAPLWQVFAEPLLNDYYTPPAGQVYRSVERERARLGWEQMVRQGTVRMVRRRAEGGYHVVLTPSDQQTTEGPTRRVSYRSRFVHVAVGYPGVRFLSDLKAYREEHSDYSRVVNAYEPHDQVYEELLRRPSVVLVRGSGIVASRILQRLIDDRERRGANTTIIHLFRNYVNGPQGDSPTFRRPGSDGVAYQGFNFPKAAWGGQLKEQLERLDGPGRADLIQKMGGTNTPRRADWLAQLARGRQQGFYHQRVGTVQRVEPGPDQTISTIIQDPQGQEHALTANVVIDATGLESDIGENRLLADLLDHGGAQRNASNRFEVTPNFELVGTRSGHGRIYASGSITLGGYYAGVDSFLGLQYAALAIADELAELGGVHRLGGLRSTAEWWRWFRNRPPKPLPFPAASVPVQSGVGFPPNTGPYGQPGPGQPHGQPGPGQPYGQPGPGQPQGQPGPGGGWHQPAPQAAPAGWPQQAHSAPPGGGQPPQNTQAVPPPGSQAHPPPHQQPNLHQAPGPPGPRPDERQS